MLDLSHAAEIAAEDALERAWDSLDSQAALPMTTEEYYAKTGSKTECELRAYQRHYLRCKAILKYGLETHAIYMKDCSRTGMGLISPVQLFPRQRVEVRISSGRSYSLEVIRCRRRKPKCYECGTIFILK